MDTKQIIKVSWFPPNLLFPEHFVIVLPDGDTIFLPVEKFLDETGEWCSSNEFRCIMEQAVLDARPNLAGVIWNDASQFDKLGGHESGTN